jgi:hypothetical protein
MGLSLGLVVAAAAMVGCGRGGAASVADEFVGGMDKIAAAVEDIEDEAGARKAAQVIASVSESMKESAAKVQGMPVMERSKVLAERAEDMQKAQRRLASAMQALATRPDLLQIVSEEMAKMPTME